ncbi:putative Filamentation protein [Taphrina deformans PYCC 5710]|uniref:Filamentation protein n=1 Tax=Taphrina deformans (strain PYCC 5710 / ATCC 11124 / CBS 356.35 / IMI 108563 / JCM 9778 / NBRC 8474) TaxID=1097556 RepID=R4X8V7_TAPDE|nr:putative Filamentation protein [Taphrina deformans PYCC 5710]|eukprot:CCG82084.1 putative Filamentation protein [Taphrina deformans PYCC 5710]
MSSARKAARYLQALQVALSLESYHEIPELSRKVRKHDPGRTCYARSAEVQAVLLQQLDRAQNTLDNANFNDASRKFHWLELTTDDLLPQKSLLKEAYDTHKSASAEEQAFYDNTNLLYGLVIRQLDAALQVATQISTSTKNPYAFQSITLMGILNELLGRSAEALMQYQKVLVNDIAHSSAAVTRWLQFALYRSAVLDPSAERCEMYLKHISTTSSSFSSTRKLHVLSTRPNDITYSEELLRTTNFPSADSINVRLLNHVTKVMEPWLDNGEDILVAERLLDMLYEAGSKTFHSPRILRYMVHVLSALERYEEVFLALKAYLQISIHTCKTQPGSDADTLGNIVETIRYVVVQVLKQTSDDVQKHVVARELELQLSKLAGDFVIEDALVSDMIIETRGFVQLLEYRATNEEAHLDKAITLFSGLSDLNTSSWREESLAIVHCQQGDLATALGRIRRSLSMDGSSISSLLVFANLLCCEELYDRALAVLDRIEQMPITNIGATKPNIKRVVSKLMQLKIIEFIKGPSHALERSATLLTTYKHCLGASIHEAGSSPSATADRPRHIIESTFDEPIRPPTIRIESPGPRDPSASPEPAGIRAAPEATVNGARLQPGTTARSASNPTRSSSLKHSHPHKHFPQHLSLRKSASVRSLRQTQPHLDGSSRSSSPMNHPEVSSIHVITADQQHFESDAGRESQPSAWQVQQRRRDELLADIWLYIGHLCHASSAPVIDAEQAIEEARKLVGQVPAVLNLQLKLRLDIIKAQETSSEDNWNLIEEGYDFSLNLDDTNENTILSFSEFLLQRADITPSNESHRKADRLARAYELLESLKAGPSAANPKLWQLSGDVASRRQDLDRAEADYWQAVKLSDRVGIMDWYRLW